MNSDIRWLQRFENFDKSFNLLTKALAIPNPNETERAGIIQFFEITFELGWKLLKDYLEEEGFTVNSPREAIKQAFQSDIIQQGDVWMDALVDRNLTVHTYDESKAREVELKIRNSYFPAIEQLHTWMKERKTN